MNFYIFQISMVCAGSTSLCEALNILGIPSLHYQGPDNFVLENVAAKNLKLNRRIFYPYDKKYIGFCDFNGYKFYKILYEMYPTSKFIYTWRAYKPWINSAMKLDQNLFEKKYNRKMSNKEFDLRKQNRTRDWLERSTDIPEFFKDKSPRFLEMRICDGNGDGWNKLCNFLQVDIPNLKFPHLPSNNYIFPNKQKI